MKNLLLLAFVAILLGFQSCLKDEHNAISPFSQSDLQYSQIAILPCSEFPMLSFDSEESFRETVSQLHSLPENQYASIPILSDFTSERTFINNLKNLSETEICSISDNGRLGSENVELSDKVLSSLVNPSHEIRIAGVVFEINNDFVYAYLSCQDKDAVNTLKLNKNSIVSEKGKFTKNLDNVFVFKTEYIDNLSHDEFDVELRESETNSVLYSSGSKRKLKGQIWHSNWGIYTSLGVETVNFKKFCGIFFRAETNTINLNWGLNIMSNPTMTESNPCHNVNLCSGLCTDLGVSWSGTKSGNNTSKVDAVFDWAAGIGVTLTGGSITGLSGVSGIPIKIRRNMANSIPSLSNHNAITGCCGTITVPTVKWKSCN